MQSTLKKFMSKSIADRLGQLPTLHINCIMASGGKELGVARPGKTARDKANGMIPHQRNRRMYDKNTDTWYRV